MDHNTLGSRCFQKGDNLGALEHFNMAIKCSSPKLVPALLNKRSVVYIKLEKFQQALRDGREIIKRVPDMAMGYLRCGQIVQLMGQREKALDILERGLQKVPVGNEDRKTLSKHYETLRKQTLSANRLDPLTRLPQEIVHQIWDHIDLKARSRCLFVSKGWKKFMESYPPLWQDLKITNSMPAAALTAWLKRAEHSGYNLRSATITSHDYNDKCRNHIMRIKRRSKLERLELRIPSGSASIPAMLPDPSQYLKTLVVTSGSWVLISLVKQIMADYTHLEHVEFHGVPERDSPSSWPEMPNLQSIVLRALSVHSNMIAGSHGLVLAWNDLIKASPNMKSAKIKNWTNEAVPGIVDMAGWTKLTHLDISGTQFTCLPVFPSTLVHLEAEGARLSLADDSELDQKKDFFHLPKLEYLGVINSGFFDVVNDLANLALASGSLKELYVGDNGPITTNSRNSWLKSLPAPSSSLTTLSLHEEVELPENIIIALLRQYPNLQDVILSYTSATGSTLRELFERKNKPAYVDMEGCEGCYYDAVEAARKVGIEVAHQLAPKKKVNKGGRHPGT